MARVRVGQQVMVRYNYGLGAMFEFVGTVVSVNGPYIRVEEPNGARADYPECAVRPRRYYSLNFHSGRVHTMRPCSRWQGWARFNPRHSYKARSLWVALWGQDGRTLVG